jgi:hypothetical protein
MPVQQRPRCASQDVLRHPGFAGVDAAGLPWSDILVEPRDHLLLEGTQHDDHAVIAELDVLPVAGHALRRAAGTPLQHPREFDDGHLNRILITTISRVPPEFLPRVM